MSIDDLRSDRSCEEILLYASHFQFHVQDSDEHGDTSSDAFWTKAAVENKLAIVDGIVAVGTGSYGDVRVFARLHQACPPLEIDEWDHVTEAGLDINTGLLLINGCLSFSGLFFRVKPGHYRVRCCHANLAQSVDNGEGGDWYFVEFWPSERFDAVVLKRDGA